MSHSESNPSHRWQDVQRLGVLAGVTSLEDYERLTAIGWNAAQKYLSISSPNPFQSTVAQNVHELTFGEVHEWAGEFRKSGEAVILGGYAAADSWRIARELTLLQIQCDLLGAEIASISTSEIQSLALVCAFQHLRFERIHPFRDGNGRVGRLLLGGAIYQQLQAPIAFAWARDRAAYFEALKAGNKGELSLLANFVLNGCEQGGRWTAFKSPFRIAPRMFEMITETTIEDDLAWSRTSPKKI